MNLLAYSDAGILAFVPLALLLFGIYSFYRAYQSSRSNSTTQIPGTTIDNTGNVPITKLGSFWFGVALTVFAIITFLMIRADYIGV